MSNKNRKPVQIDSDEEGKYFDSLFAKESTNEEKQSKKHQETEPTQIQEPRLQQFEKIRDYYKNDKSQKQYSIYLPESIQKMIKRHAILEDKSFSQVAKELFLDHYLSNSEIKSAYNDDYDRRNGLKP